MFTRETECHFSKAIFTFLGPLRLTKDKTHSKRSELSIMDSSLFSGCYYHNLAALAAMLSSTTTG